MSIGRAAMVGVVGVLFSIISAGQSLAQGLIRTPPEELKDVPEVPVYRDWYPRQADLSDLFPPPGKQINGSCTGWAVGYAARAYYAATLERRSVKDRYNNPIRTNIPSPAYIYNSLVAEPGKCGHGIQLPDALNLLRDKGAVSLHQLPEVAAVCNRPPSWMVSRATDFRIIGWRKISEGGKDIFLEKI